MYRAERITREIKRRDSKLFCRESTPGMLCIYRSGERAERYVMDDGSTLWFFRPDHHFVTALTDIWTIRGKPVDWGLEPIMKRLDSLDLWRRDIVSDIEEQERKREESNARDRMTKNEAFLSDFRSQFAKATSDINTANMNKTDPRKKREKHAKY